MRSHSFRVAKKYGIEVIWKQAGILKENNYFKNNKKPLKTVLPDCKAYSKILLQRSTRLTEMLIEGQSDEHHQSISRICFAILPITPALRALYSWLEADGVKFNIYGWMTILVIRSVSDVLRAQSRFVKFVGGEAVGRTPYTFYKPTLGPKYVSNRPYNEFITPTTFI